LSYPAVVVSEDFFANSVGEPTPDANPNYHESDDNTIDSSFASDTVCAILKAIEEIAQT
jgi:hypothetical protein